MCNTCHAFSINNPEAGSHPYAAFLRLTNVKEDAQVEVSDAIFQVLVEAETCFRRHKTAVKQANENIVKFLNEATANLGITRSFPTCHNLRTALVERFIKMRVQIFQENYYALRNPETTTSELASRSTGSRLLADRFTAVARAARF